MTAPSPIVLELGATRHVVRRGDVVVMAAKDRDDAMLGAFEAARQDGTRSIWILAGPDLPPPVVMFEDVLRAIAKEALARPPP